MEVMDYQVQAIGKAIRPLFADYFIRLKLKLELWVYIQSNPKTAQV